MKNVGEKIEDALSWLSMVAITACGAASMLLIFLMLLWLAYAYAPWIILAISIGIVIYAVCYIAVMVEKEVRDISGRKKEKKNVESDRQTA